MNRTEQNRTVLVIILILTIGASFSFGFISSQFKIFPYQQIRSIRNIVNKSTGNFSTPSPGYLHKKTFFEQHGIRADIVMIGDSITDGAEWQELFSNIRVVNRGIGGDTSAGILNRMDSIISTNAKKAFIMVGINDLNRGISPEDIFNNYKEIINILQSNDITPIIQSTLFTGERLDYLNKSVGLLNNKLQEFAKINNIEFINLNAVLSSNGTLNIEYSEDGLHLNGFGYSVWKKEIESLFK